jgi:hypothetical protein
VDQVPFERGHERVRTGIQTDVVVDACVVHQSMQLAELGQRGLHGRLARGGVGQFDLEEARTRLRFAKLPFESGLQRSACEDHWNRAFRRELQADRTTDAGTAAGDDHDLVGQVQVHGVGSAAALSPRRRP